MNHKKLDSVITPDWVCAHITHELEPTIVHQIKQLHQLSACDIRNAAVSSLAGFCTSNDYGGFQSLKVANNSG